MFTGAFQISAGGALNSLIVTDISDYSDEAESTFLTRKVYLYKVGGLTLSYPYQQNIPATAGANPVATIEVIDIAPNGSNLTVATSPPMGSVALGSYTVQVGDNTINQIAEHLSEALSSISYDISVDNAIVSVELLQTTAAFNGQSLVLSNSTIPEIPSRAVFNVTSLLSIDTGTLITIDAQQPNNAYVTIGTYTKQADDTTTAVMAPRLVTAITGNIYGYVPTTNLTNVTVTAPSGLGATQNGKQLLFSFGMSTASSNFSNGVNEIGAIPNDTTPFTGGLAPTSTTEVVNYISFPYSLGNQVAINIPMLRDYALLLVTEWVSLDPQDGSTYTAQKYALFQDYNNSRLNGVVSATTARPSVIQDAGYMVNLAKCFLEKDNAMIAIYYNQQTLSQGAVNREAELLSKQLTYF